MMFWSSLMDLVSALIAIFSYQNLALMLIPLKALYLVYWRFLPVMGKFHPLTILEISAFRSEIKSVGIRFSPTITVVDDILFYRSRNGIALHVLCPRFRTRLIVSIFVFYSFRDGTRPQDMWFHIQYRHSLSSPIYCRLVRLHGIFTDFVIKGVYTL